MLLMVKEREEKWQTHGGWGLRYQGTHDPTPQFPRLIFQYQVGHFGHLLQWMLSVSLTKFPLFNVFFPNSPIN